LWEADADAMRAALERHDAIVRRAIDGHGGYVFSTGGDGLAVAFGRAGEAVAAAVEAQRGLQAERWPAGVELRVRMGLHTGETQERDGDYFGPPVNRAARIMAAGHGGQVLVSAATTEVLAGSPGVELVDLGAQRLRGLVEPVRVFAVRAGGLGWVDRPLVTAEGMKGNLPRPVDEFVGRVEDLKRLAADVGPRRVVTLTGVGGVGKTRLALETAEGLSPSFADGVWWCDLAPLDDPGGLVAAVAATLGIALQAEHTPIDAIVDGLRGRNALVVFDNCEHLLDTVPSLIKAVGAGCAAVAVLATSREPLGVAGERVWPVRSLDPETDGVELFIDRASAADATFTPGDRAVLVELCRHLDGIPLAIELAAARVRVMSPAEILERLGDRLRLLRGGARGGLDRHRTLATTLDWSYGLLSPTERALLDRLAVFAGSFDLAAVEAVCTDDVVDALDVVDLVSSLVDKSMVVAERSSTGTRYRLLETVRHYTENHLAQQDGLGELRDRHLEHYLEVAEAALIRYLNDYTSGRVVFDREWDNLRAATNHALARRDSEVLARMFAALGLYPGSALRFEVLDWARQAAEIPDARPATFGMAASLAATFGRFDEGVRLAEAGIAAAPSSLDPQTQQCWTALFISRERTDNYGLAYEAAAAAHQTSSALWGEYADGFWSAVLAVMGTVPDTAPDDAARWAQRAETLIASRRNPSLSAHVLAVLATYYERAGDPDRGIAYCREALAVAEEHDIARSRNLARIALARLLASILGPPAGRPRR